MGLIHYANQSHIHPMKIMGPFGHGPAWAPRGEGARTARQMVSAGRGGPPFSRQPPWFLLIQSTFLETPKFQRPTHVVIVRLCYIKTTRRYQSIIGRVPEVREEYIICLKAWKGERNVRDNNKYSGTLSRELELFFPYFHTFLDPLNNTLLQRATIVKSFSRWLIRL